MDALKSGAIFNIKDIGIVRSPPVVKFDLPEESNLTKKINLNNGNTSSLYQHTSSDPNAQLLKQTFNDIYRATPIPVSITKKANKINSSQTNSNSQFHYPLEQDAIYTIAEQSTVNDNNFDNNDDSNNYNNDYISDINTTSQPYANITHGLSMTFSNQETNIDMLDNIDRNNRNIDISNNIPSSTNNLESKQPIASSALYNNNSNSNKIINYPATEIRKRNQRTNMIDSLLSLATIQNITTVTNKINSQNVNGNIDQPKLINELNNDNKIKNILKNNESESIINSIKNKNIKHSLVTNNNILLSKSTEELMEYQIRKRGRPTKNKLINNNNNKMNNINMNIDINNQSNDTSIKISSNSNINNNTNDDTNHTNTNKRSKINNNDDNNSGNNDLLNYDNKVEDITSILTITRSGRKVYPKKSHFTNSNAISNLSKRSKHITDTTATTTSTTTNNNLNWKSTEIIALYAIQSKIDCKLPNFWDIVSEELSDRGIIRTKEECQQKWFASLEDAERRREKNLLQKLSKTMQQSTNNIYNNTMNISNNNSNNNKLIDKNNNTTNSTNAIVDNEEISTKRKRPGKNDLKNFVIESIKATKDDDLFDSQFMQKNMTTIINNNNIRCNNDTYNEESKNESDIGSMSTDESETDIISSKKYISSLISNNNIDEIPPTIVTDMNSNELINDIMIDDSSNLFKSIHTHKLKSNISSNHSNHHLISKQQSNNDSNEINRLKSNPMLRKLITSKIGKSKSDLFKSQQQKYDHESSDIDDEYDNNSNMNNSSNTDNSDDND